MTSDENVEEALGVEILDMLNSYVGVKNTIDVRAEIIEKTKEILQRRGWLNKLDDTAIQHIADLAFVDPANRTSL